MAETAVSPGRYLPVLGRLMVARIRSEWQYRISFVSFVASQALVTALELAALLILLEITPTLGGWSRAEVLLLYGLASVPFAASDALVSAVEDVSAHIRSGSFDRLLLRPVPPLVQIVGDEFELRRVGKLIPTTAALVWAVLTVDVDWGPGRIAVLVLALLTGFAIYCALWIGTAATAFWTTESREAMNAFTYGGAFINGYPLHLYRNWIRLILGWILPLAFVAYVPSLELVDAPNPLGVPRWLVWLSPAVAVAALGFSLGLWQRGTLRYQSTGS